MSSTPWKSLVRFVGRAGQHRLGQPVDATLDVGLAVAEGRKVEVNVIEGDIFTGTVTNEIDVVVLVCVLAPIMSNDVEACVFSFYRR